LLIRQGVDPGGHAARLLPPTDARGGRAEPTVSHPVMMGTVPNVARPDDRNRAEIVTICPQEVRPAGAFERHLSGAGNPVASVRACGARQTPAGSRQARPRADLRRVQLAPAARSVRPTESRLRPE